MEKSLPLCIWITGLSGAGKTTLGKRLKEELDLRNIPSVLIDGDELRKGLNKDIGYSLTDRMENIRRVTEITKLILKSGVHTICCFISPTAEIRNYAKLSIGLSHFVEVYADTPLKECIKRDPKGLYRRALNGEIINVSGLDSPYDSPKSADIHIKTEKFSEEESFNSLLKELLPIMLQTIDKNNQIMSES